MNPAAGRNVMQRFSNSVYRRPLQINIQRGVLVRVGRKPAHELQILASLATEVCPHDLSMNFQVAYGGS